MASLPKTPSAFIAQLCFAGAPTSSHRWNSAETNTASESGSHT
ncbi:hypothetical protein [Actinokineospora sp.]